MQGLGTASKTNRKRYETTGAPDMNLSQSLQSASLTDPGRVRDHNEDCIEARPDIGLYVLADGMGGYNAGEVASGMATSLIADGLQEAWLPAELARMGREEAKDASE